MSGPGIWSLLPTLGAGDVSTNYCPENPINTCSRPWLIAINRTNQTIEAHAAPARNQVSRWLITLLPYRRDFLVVVRGGKCRLAKIRLR